MDTSYDMLGGPNFRRKIKTCLIKEVFMNTCYLLSCNLGGSYVLQGAFMNVAPGLFA